MGCMTDQPPTPDPRHPTQQGPAGRGWWGEATSTGGGRAALILAAVFGTLLLVTGVGLTAAFVAHNGPWNRDERAAFSRGDGPGMGMGRGPGDGRGQGGWMGNRQQGDGDRNGIPAPDRPMGPGNGQGQGRGDGSGMGRGAGAGLAGVLHGEYTTNVTGTPTVMVVQRGEVTAYTAGASVSVKSADGFTATYALDGATATAPGSGQVAQGSQVLVVAAKEGMKATRIMALG